MISELVLPFDFALIIITATLLGFLTKKTGQPTIVAYIFTGLLLGPVFLNAVSESALTRLISELGLGFLLFLVGIELDFEEIRDILGSVTKIALGQTVLQTALAFAVSYMLGFTLIETSVLAVATVFGATPVVIKILSDKDELSTLPSKIDVGVLIIQDIILIVTLTVLSVDSFGNVSQVATSILKILGMSGAIAGLSFVSSRWILPDIFERIADNKQALLIYGITWAFTFISLASYLGISIEVGAFLAGLSLGQLPYSQELQERVRPITNFFIMIFFSSIGLSIDAASLTAYWKEAFIGAGVLMAGNFLIMFYLIDRENFTPETSFLGSINMTQVSEFSLVVGAAAAAKGFIGDEIIGYLSMMALITMSLSAYLINYNRDIYSKIEHLLSRFDSEDKQDIEIKKLENHAVIIGYDTVTKNLIDILEDRFEDIVVIDNGTKNIDELARSEVEFIHADVKHSEIRNAAGIKKAKLIVNMSSDFQASKEIIEYAGRKPTIFVKANSLEEAGELYEMGAHYVMIKHMLTGEKLSEYVQLYIEDRELFKQEVSSELDRIRYGGRN
ncbi:cation:proton antiporter [Candidatus Nanohalococcus occultus]|uniref:Kef-type K transport system, membrane componentfused TrkA K transport system n=1 Tax=Candidatus Nanohalococcus occultus TaxID=2978047 RepID=A0ABY8CDB2_9ARCH|nr:Kef-type K transport system, membrane componentfused TrkA K transport system [Candidatus Nanohaloarchaeota archaeon SVXNc]